MAYIALSDITDSMINDFPEAVRSAKITLSTTAFDDILNKMGLLSSQVASPVPYVVKRWCIFWLCAEICLDYMGKNNVPLPDIEKYKIKYDIYAKLLSAMNSELTVEAITGSAVDPRDRATTQTTILYRN